MTSQTVTREQLRRRRKSLGISLDDIALSLGRGNASALSRWERGKPGYTLGGLSESEYDKLLSKIEKKRGRS